MNIAIIVRKLNVKGGTQRQALHLARQLKICGHRVTLYTFLYSPEACYQELLQGLDVVSLGRYPSSRFLFFQEYRIAKELSQLIDRNTDVLNPHDQVSYRVAAYFKRAVNNIPSVWMMNDMPTKVFSLMRDRELDPTFRPGLMRQLLAYIFDWFDIRRSIAMQDVIAVLDDRDRKWVKTYFRKNAYVLRNGIDGNTFPYTVHTPPERHVKILMTGIFFPHRRFEDGIDALQRVRAAGVDAHLTIIGDYGQTPYAAFIQSRIASLGLWEVVTLQGKVSEEELKTAYRDHDMLIFPSHLQSWGIVVFEALASGLPVIVSRTAGASEVLTDGVDALLVDAKRPDRICDAILQLCGDPELYHRLSKNGRTLIEQKISWKNYSDSMHVLFEKSVKNHVT